MTPAARIAAAAQILDEILAGKPAEQALTGWARASRFAGSGDRAAIRDLVFDSLRRRASHAALGGGLSGRGLMIGGLREAGRDPAEVFTGEGHAPAPLTGAETTPQPPPDHDLPEWLWPEWAASLGDDAQAVAEAMRDRAPVWLRVNALKASLAEAARALAADGVETVTDQRLTTALRVVSGERRIAASSPYRDGLVELQDLSPQLACAAVPVEDGQSLLDFCAGGGGKTLALGARAARAALRLTAHDAIPRRMSDLPARAARAGLRVTLSPPAPLARDYDLVVADVPCSGSGTWRRTPDAKWRLSAEDLDAVVALQARILDQAAALTRPGGVLAYMTCSLLMRENDGQISGFLARSAGWNLSYRRLFTPLDASDGFFLALMRRG
ncbi:MAG: RsmB/NOP family class I SAM-dependent RNA methyltransferase [Paracoccus sp. (in: a-proteobacteria)]|nr:RsmB/NOP family class I SAM-dependent RNA methyltransferase [Paracoccus sp. (in: a-proteobacteria)]